MDRLTVSLVGEPRDFDGLPFNYKAASRVPAASTRGTESIPVGKPEGSTMMRLKNWLAVAGAGALLFDAVRSGRLVAASTQSASVDRTVLPIAEPSCPPITQLDARKATPPPASR
jgi:hypothetical protein